mmetsp:Transcript_14839/g.22562  ORF Transcript_14839/g.22562 Transcript_14839/m.22562 type:complete len:88 (-) Transcript_14839:566-829(-)
MMMLFVGDLISNPPVHHHANSPSYTSLHTACSSGIFFFFSSSSSPGPALVGAAVMGVGVIITQLHQQARPSTQQLQPQCLEGKALNF